MGLLLLALPAFVGSVLVVGILASLIGPLGLGLFLLWLVSGLVLVLYPPAENLLARFVLRVRQPTPSERAAIEFVWGPVTRAAGTDGARYTLWVEDSDHMNAMASGGRIVALTRGALHNQPPHHLAALLAHELGHHLGGHAWAKLLATWYAIPGRAILRVVRVIVRFALAVTKIFSLLGYLFGLFFVGISLLVLFTAYPPFLLVYVVPLVMAWTSRAAEFRADRLAAKIGYGRALIEALNVDIANGNDDERSRGRLLARLMASHPQSSERIRRLEEFEIGVGTRREGSL